MATILYRDGDTHEVDGVVCEMGMFDPSIVPTMINAGWVADPKELVESEDEELEDEELKQLQEEAKELKVKSWHLIKDKDLIKSKIEEKKANPED